MHWAHLLRVSICLRIELRRLASCYLPWERTVINVTHASPGKASPGKCLRAVLVMNHVPRSLRCLQSVPFVRSSLLYKCVEACGLHDATRLEAIAIRLEAIATRLKAIAIGVGGHRY